ncbi:MGMT family protein [Actinocrispum wychmicini]|uniref:Alkylated DNA nucleotide flippase Atl1 n=1 Tax=Actinocrispum wychmicini TaxID=1213861 RepID=A0A4R2JIS1_9PSEU|nr:MGMT family protein [Actinocrispum wychmicini]TCO58667.1 alkylated DNA nucleotide flippase Atl1 [Actinocrispum wychmicini]
MDEQLHEKVRELIKSIPAGSVASYGDIAELAKAPSPRLVGRILAEDGHDLPWHRVLRADGTPAPHLQHEQLELLRAEGVLADENKVNMRTYRWDAVRPDTGPPGLFDDL